jgi:hypothetical protein
MMPLCIARTHDDRQELYAASGQVLYLIVWVGIPFAGRWNVSEGKRVGGARKDLWVSSTVPLGSLSDLRPRLLVSPLAGLARMGGFSQRLRAGLISGAAPRLIGNCNLVHWGSATSLIGEVPPRSLGKCHLAHWGTAKSFSSWETANSLIGELPTRSLGNCHLDHREMRTPFIRDCKLPR